MQLLGVKIVLVTHCSSMKTEPPRKSLRAAELAAGTADQVAAVWLQRVGRIKRRFPARELYTGVGAGLVKRAAQEAGVPWYVVSAGHGLVYAHARIPSYDLSVGSDRSSVVRKLKPRGKVTPSTWWMKLTAQKGPEPLRRLIERRQDALIIIALSARYLKMIAPELEKLDASTLARVRIVGARSSIISKKLHPIVMPYDARLNSRSSDARGGHVTFAQRAALHFVGLLAKDKRLRSLASHFRLVQHALRSFRAPRRTQRKQVSDRAIQVLIKRLQRESIDSPGVALQVVRRTHLVACEESRFRRIWNAVAK